MLRGLIGAVLAVVVVSGLSACDHFLPEPLAFTEVGEQPVVRVCIPLEITEISIKTYSTDEDHRGTVVWHATGSLDAVGGTEFAVGTAPEGLVVDIERGPSFVESDEFAVEMEVRSARGGSWSTFSYIESADLVAGSWLDGSGAATDVPCSQEECAPNAACFNDWPNPTGAPTLPEPTFTPLPLPTP